MFAVLIKKEILNNILSFRFAVTFILFFILISGSLVMMAANHSKQMHDYFNVTAAYRQRVEQMRNFQEFEIFGMTSRRKPNPLSVMAMGLEPDMSRSVTNSLWQDIEIGGSPYANPLFALFATPDVTYVITIIVSLLAILFVFDAVSGEKEEETLKLMLSNSVPRDLILMAKCVGAMVCLCASFLISLGAGLIAAHVITSLAFTSTEWLRIGVLVVVSLLYIAVFLMLGLFISASTQRSGTSLMISLLAWVILVLGIPNLVPVVARQVVPLPSMARLAGEERAIQEEEWDNVGQRLREARTQEERRQLITEMRQAIERRLGVLVANYANRFIQQAALAKIMSRVSPSACFTYASTTIAQTGIDAYTDFVRYVYLDFRGRFERSIPELRRESGSRERQVGSIDFEKLPKFEPKQDSVQLSIKKALTDIGLLCGYCTLFFLGAFIKFLRYDVK